MATPLSVPANAPAIPRAFEVRQFFYQNAVIGETQRFRVLDRRSAFYHCRQYDHLQYDWWGKNADVMETISPMVQVPLGFTQPAVGLDVRSKRPTAPIQLAKAVVDRFTGLLFSESRKPTIAVENDPDTEAFFHAVMEQCMFWARVRQARTMGGSCGTSLITVGVRNGEYALEIHDPKHVTVLWKDRRSMIPEAVLKMYKHIEYEEIIDEKTRERKGVQPVEYLYRRIISSHEDVVFKPVRADKLIDAANWEVESEIQHNLGFFPGVWVQNLPELEDIDGDPDCQGGWQMLDTIDRMLAQMNKGVLLNLDPTLVLGYDHREVEAQGGIRKGSDHALTLGKGGTADYLEITGSGIEAGTKLVNILKENFLSLVRCVMVDPSTISGSAQSAKAIEYIYAPMLEKADDLRAQWGDLCVVPLLKIIEKIARAHAAPFVGPAGREIQYKFNLPPRTIAGADGTPERVEQKLGHGGYIRCKWGPYFSPSEQDNQMRIQNAAAAKGAGLVDSETAIKHTAGIFGVQNAQEIQRKVQSEQDNEMEKAMAGMDAGVPAAYNPEIQEKHAAPAGSGGKA